jgi:ribonuclease HI
MPNIEELLEIAFHAEKVACKKLMKQNGHSEKEALLIVLACIAGEKSIHQLIDERKLTKKNHLEEKLKLNLQKKQQYLFNKQKTQAPRNVWCLWFDGSAQPNPGLCSIGVVLKSPDNRCWTISRMIGYGDSSHAEYKALISGLTLAIKVMSEEINTIPNLTVVGDSQVVINNISKDQKNNSTNLSSYYTEATYLLQHLPQINFLWRPRHENTEADALTQLAFELHWDQQHRHKDETS